MLILTFLAGMFAGAIGFVLLARWAYADDDEAERFKRAFHERFIQGRSDPHNRPS